IIDSAIEANCALSVATFGEDFWCYVMAEKKRASVTEAQRSAIFEWLGKQPQIVNLQASPLRDAKLGCELESTKS
ncbi:DUF469 family protein, partial [Undibacterium jejuense]